VADKDITHEDVTTIMRMISEIQVDVERIRNELVEEGDDGEEEDRAA
jgi:hypothetical protein